MPLEFDNLVKKIKYSLKAQHPSWSSEKIADSAYAISVSRWQSTHWGQSPFK